MVEGGDRARIKGRPRTSVEMGSGRWDSVGVWCIFLLRWDILYQVIVKERREAEGDYV